MSRLDMIKEDCRSYKLGLGFDKNYFFEQTEYLISRVEKLEAAIEEATRPPKMSETLGTLVVRLERLRAALSDSDEPK